jgi:hypothetical protein
MMDKNALNRLPDEGRAGIYGVSLFQRPRSWRYFFHMLVVRRIQNLKAAKDMPGAEMR